MRMNSYWKTVAGVSGATIIAQILGILGYLVLSRIYSTGTFGIYSAWFALSAMGGTFASGTLQTSFPLDDDGEPRRIALISTMATIAVGGLLIAVALLCTRIFWAGELSGGILALVLGSMLFAANDCFQTWASSSGVFKRLAGMRMMQSTSITAGPAVLAFFSRSETALIYGHIGGLAATIALWFVIVRFTSNEVRAIRRLASFWRERKRYFILVLPGAVVASVMVNMPVPIVKARFGDEAAGYLGLAFRALAAPAALVGNAVRDVYIRHASVAQRERGEFRREYVNSLVALLALGAACALFVVPFSRIAFALVFGEQWREAGVMALWLIPNIALGIAGAPLSFTVFIASKERFKFIWNLSVLIVSTATLVLPATLRGSIIIYSVAYALMYVWLLIACYRMSSGSTKGDLVSEPRSQDFRSKSDDIDGGAKLGAG